MFGCLTGGRSVHARTRMRILEFTTFGCANPRRIFGGVWLLEVPKTDNRVSCLPLGRRSSFFGFSARSAFSSIIHNRAFLI